jgi:hypothetical protein
VRGAARYLVLFPLLLGGAHGELVEAVVGALVSGRRDDTRLFQQVIDDRRADNVLLGRKVHLHKLAKARRVVVADRLGIAW